MVTPISMEPAHLSTILSMRTWNTSLERSGRLLRTTPWLKSSVALRTQFVSDSQHSSGINGAAAEEGTHCGRSAVLPSLMMAAF